MDRVIVVIGITGQQGSSVGDVFFHEPGWHVRGITRDSGKPAAKALVDKGIEVVTGDLDDPASLIAAFKGANAIFGVTDFWQFARDPATYEAAKAEKIGPNEVCYRRELAQAKNIIDAAASPEVLKTLERFVFSTLSETRKWSNGTIKWNLHFDGKAEASKYLAATYPELLSRTNSVQMGFYMTNWRQGPLFLPVKQADGKTFVIRKPSAANVEPKELPWVLPPNDAGHFVRALVLKAPIGTTMLGFSKKATLGAFCEIWTRVMREKGLIAPDAVCIDKGDMTLQEVEDAMPGGFAEELYETCIYSSKYGYDGGDPNIKSPEECGVDLSKLSDLEDFIRNEDWSQVL